jgi:predicted secreted protein
MDDDTQRDIGRLEGKVDALERTVEQMNQKLDTLSAYMAETKGGWKALLALAGFASAAGSAVTWFVASIVKKLP